MCECLDHSETTHKGQQSTATLNHRQRYKTLMSGDIADFLRNCPNGLQFTVTFCLQIGVLFLIPASERSERLNEVAVSEFAVSGS